ncbi:hypothetical protein [Nocardia sp. NPDC058705]|uniref:hypothetical protein n=1 Tax=Nocardia sp. NPDC058705 TaxID=3346609 RepID=UPI00369ACD98
MSGADAGPGAIGDFRAVGHQYGTLKDQLAAIAMCADVSLTDEQPTADIDRDLQALINDREMVTHLPDLNAAWARLGAAAEVGDAVTGSRSSPVGADPASGSGAVLTARLGLRHRLWCLNSGVFLRENTIGVEGAINAYVAGDGGE